MDLRLVAPIQEDLEDSLAVVYVFDVFPLVPFGFYRFFLLINGSTPTVNEEGESVSKNKYFLQ